jgi:hypothetical protein
MLPSQHQNLPLAFVLAMPDTQERYGVVGHCVAEDGFLEDYLVCLWSEFFEQSGHFAVCVGIVQSQKCSIVFMPKVHNKAQTIVIFEGISHLPSHIVLLVLHISAYFLPSPLFFFLTQSHRPDSILKQ